MAHWDLRARPGASGGNSTWSDRAAPVSGYLVRLSKVPAVTISAIRGWARGAGSEFALATDIRVAGDSAILCHFEVDLGSVDGGYP